MITNEEESRLSAQFEAEFKKKLHERTIEPRYIKMPSVAGWFNVCDIIEGRVLCPTLNSDDCDKIVKSLNFTEDSINALKLLIVKSE